MLPELKQLLGKLADDKQAELKQGTAKRTANRVWIPNPGPQYRAFKSKADELFYGGQAGGGKSDLLCGLAITEHRKSLILRRVNKDAKDIAKRARDIARNIEASFNGSDLELKTTDGREIEFGGCPFEDDKERRKGRAKDFYGFDEISDFTETQFKFITAWNRSPVEGQRCRVVCAGNPPTRPEGLWVIQYWAAWLDPKHPHPAKPGELRWYIRGEHDEDIEVDGIGPHKVAWDDEPVEARSRTFIPAELSDNPDQDNAQYRASLASLPAELRAAYRDGNFQAELKDDEFQVIPTAWIVAAIDRWKPDGFKEFNMTALAVDAAGGGADAATIACRHRGWYAPVLSFKGPETADGSLMAGRIIQHRRDNCAVVIDSGGGYGGTYAMRLKDNGVDAKPFNGAAPTTAVTRDASKLGFFNRRAEVWWRFREALDPNQEGGSVIALPPDDELKADLASAHWDLTRQGVKLEPKPDIKARIGRSPDKGDAVVIALAEGDKAVARKQFKSSGPLQTRANLGHTAARRRH